MTFQHCLNFSCFYAVNVTTFSFLSKTVTLTVIIAFFCDTYNLVNKPILTSVTIILHKKIFANLKKQ